MNANLFDKQYAEAACEILAKEFHKKISARSIAERIGVGEKTLQRAFKKHYGINLFAYQMRLRMEYARTLLERGDKSVKQVALMVGYKLPSSFTKKFIRYYGSSPSAWLGKSNGGS